MEVSITQFRRDIFEFANRALEGETITITYKGEILQLQSRAKSGTSLDKLTKLNFLAKGRSSDFDEGGLLDTDDAAMKAEMQAEWEKDWEEI